MRNGCDGGRLEEGVPVILRTGCFVGWERWRGLSHEARS